MTLHLDFSVEKPIDMPAVLEALQREILTKALKEGGPSDAARMLCIARNNLYMKRARFDLLGTGKK